jgi:hypothetical protein
LIIFDKSTKYDIILQNYPMSSETKPAPQNTQKPKILIIEEGVELDKAQITTLIGKEFLNLQGIIVYDGYDGAGKKSADKIHSYGHDLYTSSNQYICECKDKNLGQKAAHFAKRYALIFTVVSAGKIESLFQSLSDLPYEIHKLRL